jgi:hypothetical protein
VEIALRRGGISFQPNQKLLSNWANSLSFVASAGLMT